MPMRDSIKRSVSGRLEKIAETGASACGIIPAAEIDLSLFESSVSAYPRDLDYLKNKSETRKNVSAWFPQAKSVLVCLYQYWHKTLDYEKAVSAVKDPEEHLRKTGRRIPTFLRTGGFPEKFKISRYALSGDYHAVLRKNLEEILKKIKEEFKGAEGRIFVDTSPVLEKELARLAGLGARGKNTLLLNKKLGSYVFIGGIALNLTVEPAKPQAKEDFCSACDKCFKACPTGALSEKGLDPLKCVSYWTTAAKTARIPDEIRKNSRGWLYGCDICQEACPYNSETEYSIIRELLPIAED